MADFDYKKMHDYVNADPELTKLKEKRTLSHKKMESYKSSARTNIEKMHGLYLAKTAVLEKFQYDEQEKKVDEKLQEITGQCSECWNGDWETSLEVVFDGQLSCSVAIANLAKQMYKLSEDIQIMNGLIDTMEDELRKQFRKQFYKDQEKAKKVKDV
ncbi:MAG TPA: hypothetical protein DHV30_06490 [Balneola sp.]|nr:hypothetical protein [Balneola sp.]